MSVKSFVLIYSFFFLCAASVWTYTLKQVLIFSRHNVRAPLTTPLDQNMSLNWPKWSAEISHLTPRGAMLEGYMGEYFIQWLNKEGLLPEGCPEPDLVHIYANNKQRTKATAEAFAATAFMNCNIPVIYEKSDHFDPVFNPVVHNNTETFKEKVLKDMQNKLREVNIEDSYKFLDNIAKFRSCGCDADEKNEIVFKVGEEPNLKGPLFIGNSLVDSFLMEYYDGMPLKDVAWGKITTPEQWKLLLEINRENHNVRFNTSTLAKDTAKLLINYMTDIFLKGTPKFTLLVGHDVNIYSILAAIDFESYELPNQHEKTPIGGKLIFQKWNDGKSNRDLLKVNYVYQTTKQLRDGVRLSLINPPEWVLLQIKNCKLIDGGFCLWTDFINILKNLQ